MHHARDIADGESVPTWWERRRFGLLVHTTLSAVPAWAPVGASADWYWPSTEGPLPHVMDHPAPLAENVEHHARAWPHIEHFEDFLPFLAFDAFDAGQWTGIARDAGMSYVLMTAKHYDGLCWWDAPGTDHTVLHGGPARNVLGELADAARGAGLPFGVSYSLLDWHDPRYSSDEFVDEVVHPQVLDLVERYGIDMLGADGHWGAGASHWRSDELLRAARRVNPDLVHNERWWSEHRGVRSYEYRVPDTIVDQPWEMRRGLGSGLGHSGADTDDHLLTANGIVSLLTEVVAKGGHLLLGVGPDASGAIPAQYAERLRAAGGWVRRHQDLIDRGLPWDDWGDEASRYLVLDDVLYAVDVDGRGHFAGLGRVADRIMSVTALDGTEFDADRSPDGVHIKRSGRPRSRLPQVYRVALAPAPEPPIELFPAPEMLSRYLADELRDAEPGGLVQLGDGTYLGPARIPDGVTVRGLGPDRTRIDGMESCALVLGDGARLEHCTVTTSAERIVWVPKVLVRLAGTDTSLLGCRIGGHVSVSGPDARVLSSQIVGVVATDADRVQVVRCSLRGMNWDTGIEVTGGSGHVVDGNQFEHFMCGISLARTVASVVRRNTMSTRSWGVRLVDTEGTLVYANHFAHMTRAVDVDGGIDVNVKGNAAELTDSGCLVQRGATDVAVSGNRWERCRVGLMCWEAGTVQHAGNSTDELGEAGHELIVGP